MTTGIYEFVETAAEVEYDDSPEARREKLQRIVDAGGVMGSLAAEALVSMDDRAKRQAAEKLLQSVEDGEATEDEVKEVARQVIKDRQVATDKEIIAATKKLMKAAGDSDDDIARAVEELTAGSEALARYNSREHDFLDDSPEYREAQLTKYGQERAQALAAQELAASWADVVKDAEEGIARTYADMRDGIFSVEDDDGES